MKKLVLLFAIIGSFALTNKSFAQLELNSTLDYIYTTAKFNLLLRFDINDQLQSAYLASKDKWLEVEIVKDEYIGEGKGWIYTIQDGFGNQYTIERPTLGGNVKMKDVAGNFVDLIKKEY